MKVGGHVRSRHMLTIHPMGFGVSEKGAKLRLAPLFFVTLFVRAARLRGWCHLIDLSDNVL